MVEHECPRCHREVDQLPLGDLCTPCRRDIARRSRRIARYTSLGSTALLLLYAVLRNFPEERVARVTLAISALVWFVVSRRIALRVAEEWLK